MATDSEIIRKIQEYGVDHARLKNALDSKDPWGKMVHAFEYLTVLEVVEKFMGREEKAREIDGQLRIE